MSEPKITIEEIAAMEKVVSYLHSERCRLFAAGLVPHGHPLNALLDTAGTYLEALRIGHSDQTSDPHDCTSQVINGQAGPCNICGMISL